MKKKIPKKSEGIMPVISEINQLVKQFYGDRLKYLVLYGSYARGNFKPNSDIDLLIVLDSVPSVFKEIDTITGLTLDLVINCEKYISTSPVSLDNFEHSQMPFYKNVRKDGIVL